MRPVVRVCRASSAEDDLDAIAGYFGALNPAATIAMLDALAEAEQLLATHPAIGHPGRVSGTREFVVTRTPFIVVYVANDEVLTILRFLHGRQLWPKG